MSSPASVYSIFMTNIDNTVVESQKKVIDRLLPEGWTFTQYLHTPAKDEVYNHASALAKCLAENKNSITVFLDIDCVPTTEQSFEFLAGGAREGALVGAIQRANHIENGQHLYVGPFCMAFLNAQYKKLGSPSFNETARGDCGEELTYIWEQNGQPVKTLWPSHVYHPQWDIQNNLKFGFGTTYEDKFYHAFAIRQGNMQEQFIIKCKQILESVGNKKKEISPPPPSQEVKPREITKKVTPKEEQK